MSFIISVVLACTVILATFMLQLCDADVNRTSSVISFVSFVGVLSALYFVDYKKKFSLGKTPCNILVTLAVLSQLGTLVNSRQEFLAFSIANILASIQTILFFQSKTLRKCYQIVSIAFIEVAVGCVFQRSSAFVASLPFFVVLGFSCYSLLFLWSERKYYAERVALKSRFSGSKNLHLITAEEPLHAPEYKPLDAFDSAAALQFGERACAFDSPRFFRRPSTFPIRFDFEYFRRFFFGAIAAFCVAVVFFCLFPRLDHFGFRDLSFNEISWGRGSSAVVKTGFRSTIELGDLGPALDSKEVVMTVKILDVENVERAIPLDPYSSIYFRGVPLADYNDRRWSELTFQDLIDDYDQLKARIKSDAIADPEFILSHLERFESETPSRSAPPPINPAAPRALFQPLPQNGFFSPQLPGSRSSFGFAPSQPVVLSAASREMNRTPTLGTSLKILPEEGRFDNFEGREFDDFAQLASKGEIAVSNLRYDLRSDLIAMEVKLNPLDVKTFFSPAPVFMARQSENLSLTQSSAMEIGDSYRSRHSERANHSDFWFISTAFTNGRQAPITPNQEYVWRYIHKYLEIDREKLPKLIAKAREWDEESQLPKENFVARARYLEKRLRDSGEYTYNRVGALRDPDVDPLEDFISENKYGHCEYFAGALAMMLRAVGIPSRVVVGFATYSKANDKETTVRQSDAHSWVEAYIPPDKLPKPGDVDSDLFAGSSADASGRSNMPEARDWSRDGAWLRLDATPSAARDAERPGALALGIFAWSKLLRTFGLDFVLNFNAARQMRAIYEPMIKLFNKTLEQIRAFFKDFGFIKRFVDQCRETIRELLAGDWSTSLILRLFFELALLAIAGYLTTRLFKSLWSRIRKAAANADEEDRRRIESRAPRASLLYRNLENALENRLDIRRRRDETPREFFERFFSAEDERAKNDVVAETPATNRSRASSERVERYRPTSEGERGTLRSFVERYYRARYGGTDLDAQETEDWTRSLQNLNLL